MPGKYYIKFGLSNKADASSKAMRDIMQLLDDNGWCVVESAPVTAPKAMKLADIPVLIFTLLFRLGKGGLIMYILPSNHGRIKLINALRKIGGYRTICFINDIESLRMPKSMKYTREEFACVRNSDIVIAPNSNSENILLQEYGCTNAMVHTGVWDYLLNTPTDFEDACKNGRVVFAGNLRKAPFLRQLGDIDLEFEIWGDATGLEGYPENLDFKGACRPDELPARITAASWGLVWDGESIEKGDGQLGTYLRFNNSHKCALYLAAGIPVIVWDESGMASFVKEHGCGICISSLRDITSVTGRMTDEEYLGMRKNAREAGKIISEGGFFLAALKKAIV